MSLEAILDSNRAFVRGREPAPLPPPETMRLAVVACYDPRLDPLLHPALGLSPGDVFLLRTAGALVQPASSSLRSLMLAVFMFGVSEILIVGHTSCRMARFDTAAFVASFRGRGVPREAFGAEDLRTWAGAIADPRRGVQSSMANILAAPYLPHDLAVSGAVLDDTTGALEVVARSTEAAAAGLAGGFVEEPREHHEPEHDRETDIEQAPPSDATGPDGTEPLVRALEHFARTLQSKAKWSQELRQLHEELGRQKNPVAKFNILESFAKRAGADSVEVRAAFEKLKRTAADARQRFDAGEVVRLFERLARRS